MVEAGKFNNSREKAAASGAERERKELMESLLKVQLFALARVFV